MPKLCKQNKFRQFTSVFILALAISSPAFSDDMDQIATRLKLGDFSVVKTRLIPLAEAGYTRAQYNLGVSYRYGNGVEKDLPKAFSWTEKAAQAGDVKAIVNLASMYVDGSGIAQNIPQAIKWYEKAAAQGDTKAELSIAKIYRDGVGGKIDYAKAFEHYSVAADRGNDEARYNLCAFYHFGLGVNKNEEKAKALFASLRPQDVAGNLPAYNTAAGTNVPITPNN